MNLPRSRVNLPNQFSFRRNSRALFTVESVPRGARVNAASCRECGTRFNTVQLGPSRAWLCDNREVGEPAWRMHRRRIRGALTSIELVPALSRTSDRHSDIFHLMDPEGYNKC